MPGPFEAIPASAADVLRPALPGLADEIIATIAQRGARLRARDGGRCSATWCGSASRSRSGASSTTWRAGRARAGLSRRPTSTSAAASSTPVAAWTRCWPPTASAPGWPGGGSSTRGSRAAWSRESIYSIGEGDLRVHRHPVRRVRRGLRARAARRGGRAPPAPPAARGAAGRRPARRGGRGPRRRRGRRLGAPARARRRCVADTHDDDAVRRRRPPGARARRAAWSPPRWTAGRARSCPTPPRPAPPPARGRRGGPPGRARPGRPVAARRRSVRRAQAALRLATADGRVVDRRRAPARPAARADPELAADLARARLAPLRGLSSAASSGSRTRCAPGSTAPARCRPSPPSSACTRRPSATACASCASCSGTRWRTRTGASSSRSPCAPTRWAQRASGGQVGPLLPR